MTVPAMSRLNSSPKTLVPVYEREIIFRVLQGPWLDVARHRRAGYRDGPNQPGNPMNPQRLRRVHWC